MDYGVTNDIAETFVERIKFRVKMLVLLSAISLAIVFYFSFYFALVSNATAIARQIPELADVGEKMKGLLMLNTVAFAIVIIASFYILSSLVTSRTFKELTIVQESLKSISNLKVPERDSVNVSGAFYELNLATKEAISTLRDKELKELDSLIKLQKSIDNKSIDSGLLKELISSKRAFLGLDKRENEKDSTNKKEVVKSSSV